MFNAAKIQAWHDKVKEIMEDWQRDHNALVQINDAIGRRGDLEYDYLINMRREPGAVAEQNHIELVSYLLCLTLLGRQYGVSDVKNAVRYITHWDDSFNDNFFGYADGLFEFSLEEVGRKFERMDGGIPNLVACWTILAGEVYSDLNECDSTYRETIKALCEKWVNITYGLYRDLGAFVIALEGSETEEQILFYNRYMGWLEETFA